MDVLQLVSVFKGSILGQMDPGRGVLLPDRAVGSLPLTSGGDFLPWPCPDTGLRGYTEGLRRTSRALSLLLPKSLTSVPRDGAGCQIKDS